MIKMIVCVDKNGGIGFNDQLVFNIKEDMQFFKETTTGHKVIMGYNTWLSLPNKPLPNRDNYVLYNGVEEIEGATVLRDMAQVKELAENDVVFVIGGAMVYNDFLYAGIIDEAYVTMVHEQSGANKFIDIIELNRMLPNREYLQDFNDEYLKVQLFRFFK